MRYDRNWIELSRDLLSLPRRWLDFDMPWQERRDAVWPHIVGWCLLLTALELTLRVAAVRREAIRAPHGAPAAFMLLGAWMSCFHFMYYDILLTAVPFLLLFLKPWEVSGAADFCRYPVGGDARATSASNIGPGSRWIILRRCPTSVPPITGSGWLIAWNRRSWSCSFRRFTCCQYLASD